MAAPAFCPQSSAAPGRGDAALRPPQLPGAAAFRPRPAAARRRRAPPPPPPRAATDFHQARMAASPPPAAPAPPLPLAVRVAESDAELEAAAWLRARSFYAYPPERRFAGEIHQIMVAEEELGALKAARAARRRAEAADAAAGAAAGGGGGRAGGDRCACLVAVCRAGDLGAGAGGGGGGAEADPLDARLALGGAGAGAGGEVVVGTLDVAAVRAVEGEALIAACRDAAYLANVCAAPAARRRGVATALLAAARGLARAWRVEGLYVHTMAVNEAALRFYCGANGFEVEAEESANAAHYRGHCLDGVEGRGRTVLLRDARLHGGE